MNKKKLSKMGKSKRKGYKEKSISESYGSKKLALKKKFIKKTSVASKEIVKKQIESNEFDLSLTEIATEKAVPQKKTKANKREKIFKIFVDHLNFLNDKGFISTQRDIYICPLDLKIHSKLDEIDPLTLEDAPPQSLGGNAHVLTCQSCNNERGHDIDASLAKFYKDAKIVKDAIKILKTGKSLGNMKLPKSYIEVYLKINGQILVPGMLKIENDGKILLETKDTFPQNTNIELVDVRLTNIVKYSLLKAAYILLFKKTGYNLILDKCYDIVREQISNPKKQILPDKFCMFVADQNQTQTGVYFVQNKGIESMLVVFDLKWDGWKKKVFVFLPLPIRDLSSTLINLKEKTIKNRGLNLELYPQEQDWEHQGDYLMKEDNLVAMYNWIKERQKK